MPGSLHGFNGPEVVSRFSELAGLWQAPPQNAKKKNTPASTLRLAEQKQRSPGICATLPAANGRNNSELLRPRDPVRRQLKGPCDYLMREARAVRFSARSVLGFRQDEIVELGRFVRFHASVLFLC